MLYLLFNYKKNDICLQGLDAILGGLWDPHVWYDCHVLCCRRSFIVWVSSFFFSYPVDTIDCAHHVSLLCFVDILVMWWGLLDCRLLFTCAVNMISSINPWKSTASICENICFKLFFPARAVVATEQFMYHFVRMTSKFTLNCVFPAYWLCFLFYKHHVLWDVTTFWNPPPHHS